MLNRPTFGGHIKIGSPILFMDTDTGLHGTSFQRQAPTWCHNMTERQTYHPDGKSKVLYDIICKVYPMARFCSFTLCNLVYFD